MMSNAGQNTVTGISLQADVTLLFLLEYYQRSDFEELLVESADWEDFTLKFQDRIESFEVKWHAKPLSYSDIKEIIKKETAKADEENYSFKIVAKSFSSHFLRDIEHVKQVLPYLRSVTQTNECAEDNVIKKLRSKGWSNEEIAFLIRTDFIGLNSEEAVISAITEKLSFNWYLYLGSEDISALIALCFREILDKAKTGASITKSEFELALKRFDDTRAAASESFDPVLTIGTRTAHLDDFLLTAADFQNLNHQKYLTPLTSHSNQHLMYYLVRNLEKNSFSVAEIDFFLKKVLIKQSHLFTCLRLIEAKWKSNLLEPDLFIRFLSDNFDRLNFDYMIHDALGILLEILKADRSKSESVLAFLKKRIFPKVRRKHKGARRDIDYSYKYSHLPEIIIQIGQYVESDSFVELLFQFFDFTGDHYHLVVETPAKIYGFIKDYIKKDPKERIPIVLKNLKNQFDATYGISYNGYEMIGGSVGFQGSSFSVTDVGLVRYLFEPLYSEIFDKDENAFFKILKDLVFKSKQESTAKSPVYLKRAAVHVLFSTLVNSTASTNRKKLCRSYLIKTLAVKKGFPNTSEKIFNYLRGADLKEIGHDFVMDLVRQEQVKYEQDRLPTNIFVLHTVIRLIEDGNIVALDYLSALVARSEFKRLHLAEELLSLLGDSSILSSRPDIRLKLIRNFDLKNYVESSKDSDWISSLFLKNLLNDLWLGMPEVADQLIKDLIAENVPSKSILDLLANAFSELFAKHPARLYTIFQNELSDPKLFYLRFKSSELFRQNFSNLAEALIEIGQASDAKRIVDILIADADPNTDEKSDYNNHLKVKNGETSMGISGCRAIAAWVIQKFVMKNDAGNLLYSLEMTKKLLDLDETLRKSLGYPERDLYIMAQALVPLTELSHPYRRKVLNSHSAGKGDEVKNLALSVLRLIRMEFDSGSSQPKAVGEYLVSVFNNVRDLSEAEANEVLDFFENYEFEKAAGLFIFFAIYQQIAFPKSTFDQRPFHKRLENICSTKNYLRQSISWQIWRSLDNTKIPIAERKSLEDFLPFLLKYYEGDVFSNISHIIEILLKNGVNYSRHFVLLREAISIEISELKTTRGPARISLRKTARLVLAESMADFFSLTEDILAVSDSKTGNGVYGTNLYPLIQEFKSISTVPANLQSKYDEIRGKLSEFGAFIE